MKTITAKDYIGIGYFIKSRREALGICKESFCRQMGIEQFILDNWEDENLENIGFSEIKKLAQVLKYYPKLFIDGVPLDAYKNWNNFINQTFIK